MFFRFSRSILANKIRFLLFRHCVLSVQYISTTCLHKGTQVNTFKKIKLSLGLNQITFWPYLTQLLHDTVPLPSYSRPLHDTVPLPSCSKPRDQPSKLNFLALQYTVRNFLKSVKPKLKIKAM